MVFGESAGGVNTCMLLASPKAAGLFSRALMQSGGCVAASSEKANSTGAGLAEKLGCTDGDCLRTAGVDAILAAQGGEPVGTDGTLAFGFGPSVDGEVLPAAPLDLIDQGRHNRVPFAIGANADETAAFVLPLTEMAYRATILRIFGDEAGPLVLLEYPAAAYETPRHALVAVTTDAEFVCPSRTIAGTVATSQYEPVYRYFFTHYRENQANRGAFHGLELAYLFQHMADDAPAADQAVERTMLDYWTNFAESGNPNRIGLPRWPFYFPGFDSYLELAAPSRAKVGVRTEKCDFWDRLKTAASN
jgi:para-nitrobenzyl esterase